LQDDIFKKPIERQFEFNEEVAGVFDDMISRSIPGYENILDLTQKALLEYVKEGTITDIGCSTANLLISLYPKVKERSISLIGIDDSEHMLRQAAKKAAAFEADIKFLNIDAVSSELPKSKAFVANFTLQFIRPMIREELVQKIYDSLESGGVFLFAEKLISEDKGLNKFLIDAYHGYKKERGYSELEIMRKREALENVLVPYSEEENKTLCKKAGFEHVELLFRWCNFALFIALKR
jgi:tRNA (cmo5U34)-methyltransferase